MKERYKKERLQKQRKITKITLKKMKVHIKKKGKILIMNFSGKEKVDIMDIMDLIQRKNVVER